MSPDDKKLDGSQEPPYIKKEGSSSPPRECSPLIEPPGVSTQDLEFLLQRTPVTGMSRDTTKAQRTRAPNQRLDDRDFSDESDEEDSADERQESDPDFKMEDDSENDSDGDQAVVKVEKSSDGKTNDSPKAGKRKIVKTAREYWQREL
ncbi:unnamed protein product [Fusarium langsethiae]|nr:unnamed protein product [Fusarium langsethiae]